jgi:hypothetical protein
MVIKRYEGGRGRKGEGGVYKNLGTGIALGTGVAQLSDRRSGSGQLAEDPDGTFPPLHSACVHSWFPEMPLRPLPCPLHRDHVPMWTAQVPAFMIPSFGVIRFQAMVFLSFFSDAAWGRSRYSE